MTVKMEESWKNRLHDEFAKDYFTQLSEFVRSEYSKGSIYPHPKYVFRAFDECPFDRTRVVIVGQDPYHGFGQANGLCFSVNSGVDIPPSLANIFKEIESDLGHQVSHDSDLVRWARQGVLLLNATLTVKAGLAGSHHAKGWELFTDAVLHTIARERAGIVFILWGNYARKKGAFINKDRHCVIESAHPSPLSAHNGFFGSKPFSKTNAYLLSHSQKPIEW